MRVDARRLRFLEELDNSIKGRDLIIAFKLCFEVVEFLFAAC